MSTHSTKNVSDKNNLISLPSLQSFEILSSNQLLLVGVGISEWVNINEVKGIVTDQKLYNVSDFAQLPNQAFELENAIINTANSLCRGGTPRPFTPRPDGTTRRPGNV